MARNVIVLNNPKFTAALTELELATGDAFECQITQAIVNPQPVYNTIPATGCAGASQSPGRTGWQLELAWLQDWGSDPSMSQFAFDNDGVAVWYQLTPDSVGDPTFVVKGQAYVAAGGIGGTFGDGSAATSTATWPCLDKPTLPAVAFAAAE